MNKKDIDNYPSWVCTECALEAGATWPDGHIATFHNGICGVCQQKKDVTEPRDWRYPNFKNILDEE